MYDEANRLADALLKAKESSYLKSWRLTKGDKPTGKIVMVVALRMHEQREEEMTRFTEIIKASPMPMGELCPRCGGTGRI